MLCGLVQVGQAGNGNCLSFVSVSLRYGQGLSMGHGLAQTARLAHLQVANPLLDLPHWKIKCAEFIVSCGLWKLGKNYLKQAGAYGSLRPRLPPLTASVGHLAVSIARFRYFRFEY
jgi:hypothetical protein